jgi:type IV pilus assembly protein PilF
MRRLLATLCLAAGLAACVSDVTVETRSVQDPSLAGGRRRAEIHTGLAGEYYARNQLPIALTEARLAIKDDPKYVSAYNIQALIYMELREDALALQSFEQALAIAPGDSEVLNNYGWFLCQRSEASKGMVYFQRVMGDTLYPTPEKPLLNAGLCEMKQGRNAEAESYLRRALSIQPTLVQALQAMAQLSYQNGRLKDAENYIARYSRVAEPNADMLLLAVKVARQAGDKANESSVIQQLRRRYPDSVQLREATQGN